MHNVIMKKRALQAIIALLFVTISISLVPSAFAYYHPQEQKPLQPMSVSTDKSSYNFGDMLTINGKGAESYSISITILSPSGEKVTEFSAFKTSAGKFSTIWIIPSGVEKGTYTIKASDSTQIAQTTFILGNVEVKPHTEQSKSKATIPDWIRNNAKWWSDGLIGDSDFVNGIQFMIKEKIINIPNLPEQASETAEEKVPDWIRNNAGWWANGLISEDDFVNGLKYLVEQGIIRV